MRFAWETGRLIVQEEQNGATRAAYGKRLIPKLSQRLTEKFGANFSGRTLRKMRYFYLRHPIWPTSAQLDWSGYLELLPVKDEKMRRRLERRVLKEGLNARQIRELVREVRRAPQRSSAVLPPLKRPADLRLNTFRVASLPAELKENEVLIDCGFFLNRPVAKEELKDLDIAEEMSYTYAAAVERVIDGDTLLVLVEAGFRNIMRDRLRLRGIDCPEVGTRRGIRPLDPACYPSRRRGVDDLGRNHRAHGGIAG